MSVMSTMYCVSFFLVKNVQSGFVKPDFVASGAGFLPDSSKSAAQDRSSCATKIGKPPRRPGIKLLCSPSVASSPMFSINSTVEDPNGKNETDRSQVDRREGPCGAAVAKGEPNHCASGSQSNGLAPSKYWEAYVIDKRMHRRNEQDTQPEKFLVIWWKRHGRQPRTWTKRSLLLAGGHETEIDLVDD